MDWNFPVVTEKGFPKIDIVENDDNIEVQAALPGIKKEDLDISINNQTITIKASSKEEKKTEGKYFRREIIRGEFQRTFALPVDVDHENAKAEFKDGILKVNIPKTEKSKSKTIQVQ
jgi:HSP20 family protein